jgi:hypothetical protein
MSDLHATCGCCAGAESAAVHNPPGAPSLRYRIDTHAGFFARMLARLPHQPALARLTTRQLSDPSIAVLDAWAVLGDILTFYQERIANEGYLGTSTERRSIHELAAMIGYQLKPGVAASTYLAFTVEAPVVVPSTTPGATPPLSTTSPSTIGVPRGTRVQSTPAAGELPQSFETIEEITARVAWNTVRARQTRRQQLGVEGGSIVSWRKLSDAAGTAAEPTPWIWLATAASNLVAGDWLVVEVGPEHRDLSDPVSMATSQGVTAVRVRGVDVDNDAGRTRVRLFQPGTTPPPHPELPVRSPGVVSTAAMALTAANVRSAIIGMTWSEPELAAQIAAQRWDADHLTAQIGAVLAAAPQPATVSVLRQTAQVFGAVAPPYATLPEQLTAVYTKDWDDSATRPSVWQDSNLDLYADGVDLFLDRVIEGVVPGGWVMLSRPDTATPALFKIARVVERSLADFATSGKVTGLALDLPAGYKTSAAGAAWKLRTTTVRVLSQALPVGAAPMLAAVGGAAVDHVVTDRMVLGLRAGQMLAVSGDALDDDDRPLGPRSELAQLDRVEHSSGLSILHLEAPLAHRYTRASFAVCANLAAATHGETVAEETMGSGDGTAHQARVLRRPPLTLVAAPTAAGTTSTLIMRVGGVAWDEVASLLEAGPADRVYQTRTSDDGKTAIVFGDGHHGARPPTGRDNLSASYRTGMGLGGNVGAGKLTLLASRPLGLRGVVNPAAATGAEDPEPLEQARRNAPLAVRTLDRIVSLSDYHDFARSFAGVAKARGVAVWDGHGRLVHVTIAGFDGAPVATTSGLYKNLVAAFARLSDGIERVVVDSHVPRSFALEASLTVRPDRVQADVLAAARTAAETAYGFSQRELAAPVTEADVMTRLLAIPGVIAVRVTRLHRLDQPVAAQAVIAASDARWNPTTRTVVPAELLTLVPANLRLTAVKP